MIRRAVLLILTAPAAALCVAVAQVSPRAGSPRTAQTPPRRERSVTPRRENPAEAPGSPAAATLLDYGRLVRVWDLNAGRGRTDNPYAGPREAGDRMILSSSAGKSSDWRAVESAGFTLIQTDSDHLSTGEVAPAVWEFSRADADLRATRDAGLDWCYFPHFAFPPAWYTRQPSFVPVQCLEHSLPVQAFSPWDSRFPVYLSRGYQAVAELAGRREEGRPISLYLGVHGDYGETGLFMGARVAVPVQRDEWQRRFGDLHDHLGWWCADPLARRAFRDAMTAKYGDLEVLNAAWKTHYEGPDEIQYPAGPAGIPRRRWLDFVEWYLRSATGMADAVCRASARSFPDSLRMIPAGFPYEDPRGGNDNSLIAQIAARHKADVRSTHGGLRPFAENQAGPFGRLASASRFYGAPFWSEPPGPVTAEREAGRIFEAASAGCKGYFTWADSARANRSVFYRYGRYLRYDRPVVDVAMLFPTTSHLLRADAYPRTFEQGCTAVRDALNYDIVDERMVRDGALDRYRVVVMWEGTVWEAETLAKLRDWVQSGGVLAAYDFGKVESVEGDRAWFGELFAHAGRLEAATMRTTPAPGGGHPDVQIDLRRLRSEWARPFGRGWTVFYPATRRQIDGYYEVLRYLTYHLSDLDSTRRDALPADDAWDGLYATVFPDRILYYNPTAEAVTRTVVLPPAVFEGSRTLQTPSTFTHTIKVEAHGIAAIQFEPPPQELLLQCEKFTDQGGLRPSTGGAFSPGEGATHVLIPAGGQIGTRFEVGAQGRYRVIYRAARRGRLAAGEIALDGRPLRALAGGQPPWSETMDAGTVSLSPGVHTLTLRPRPGEDLRADFVVLTNDPTIAGYSFAVK